MGSKLIAFALSMLLSWSRPKAPRGRPNRCCIEECDKPDRHRLERASADDCAIIVASEKQDEMGTGTSGLCVYREFRSRRRRDLSGRLFVEAAWYGRALTKVQQPEKGFSITRPALHRRIGNRRAADFHFRTDCRRQENSAFISVETCSLESRAIAGNSGNAN